jgi:membrane protein required for colicin V production
MNLLDFLLLIPVVWLCIRGATKGFIIELATLIGIGLGILAAYYFADDLQELMKGYFSFSERTTKILAYIVIVILVVIIVWIIGKIVEKSADMLALGWLNKLLGAIVGIAKGVLIVCLLLYILEKADPGQKVIKPDVKEKSMFYKPLMEVVHSIVPE